MVNHISIDNDFFILSSDNLTEIKSTLYGYVISKRGIFDKDNYGDLVAEDVTGLGCYILIDTDDEKITISQDANGSFGLYLFERENFFAISNSLMYLVDHIKGKYKISLNREYVNGMFIQPLSNRFYAETVINEISLLNREAVVNINKKTKMLEIKNIDYQEHTIPIDSENGIGLIDTWYNRWIGIIDHLAKSTDHLHADLSGGFDSRMTFALIKGADLNMKDVIINTATDVLHTHKEDYEIAKEICDAFGYKLNCSKKKCEGINLSLEDSLNILTYTLMTHHKEFWTPIRKNIDKVYKIGGHGGEAIRGKWNYSREEFISKEIRGASVFSEEIAKKIKKNAENLLNKSFIAVEEKNPNVKENSEEESIAFYRDTWNRSHFGKLAVRQFCSNTYGIYPLMDPELFKLQISGDEYQGLDILMALIFVRYCPELLGFRFEGNRRIDEDILKYARKLNEKYPFIKEKIEERDFRIEPRDRGEYETENDNDRIDQKQVDEYFKSFILSPRAKHLFLQYFDKEIYDYALYCAEVNDYVPLRHCYFLISVVMALQSIQYSEMIDPKTPKERMDLFINEKYHERVGSKKTFGFPYHLTGRCADIILYGAGKIGRQYKAQIEKANTCKIVKWIDLNYTRYPDDGVESIYSIGDASYDYIVIAIGNKKDSDTAKNILTTMGVAEKKIVGKNLS